MAGTIGGISCTRVSGTPTGKVQRVIPWQVPGVNGYGVMIAGLGNSEFQIAAIYIGAAIGLATWANSITAKLGQPITIINDLGITYANCVLVKPGELQISPAMTPAIPSGIRALLPLEGIIA